ncbi:BnaC05g50070D [Brassica napus]|uniref:non-specific serine/threonine protein kinase n=1 Tax=Brassica napus TaxID=3708 RepID=A0A078JEY9_BRANA|nr:unnamed protein product [Brassica napus]CDY65030.1 BnaC05g50070D [Brassica napus]
MSISILLITTIVFFFVVGLPLCFSVDQRYEKCLSSPLRCGHKPSVFSNNITYPFWGADIDKPVYCGRPPFELSCNDDYQTLTLEIADLMLRVVSTKQENNTITVADESLFEDGGCPKTWDFNGDDQFTLNPNTEKMDLHTCSDPNISTTSLPNITCTGSDGYKITYLFLPPNVSDHGYKKAGEIPVLKSTKNALHDFETTLMEALQGGFELRYIIDDQVCRDCTNSTGVCGSDSTSGKFRCLCPDRPHKSSCKDEG